MLDIALLDYKISWSELIDVKQRRQLETSMYIALSFHWGPQY